MRPLYRYSINVKKTRSAFESSCLSFHALAGTQSHLKQDDERQSLAHWNNVINTTSFPFQSPSKWVTFQEIGGRCLIIYSVSPEEEEEEEEEQILNRKEARGLSSINVLSTERESPFYLSAKYQRHPIIESGASLLQNQSLEGRQDVGGY